MLNTRFSNFIKRTVSSFTTLFGQPTKMPLLINKNYLFVQSVNFGNFKSLFEIFPLHSEQQVVFDVGTNGDAEKLKPIINRGDPIIFVFYAKWSGPSRSFTPRLEAKVKGQGGKILLAKIEVREEGNELSKHFGLTTVPTIDLFKNNEYLGRYEGVIEEDFLLDNLLEDLMAGRYESVRE
ncbi:hypothetical protein ACQ4LE_001979 [Meloidogyne hapla]